MSLCHLNDANILSIKKFEFHAVQTSKCFFLENGFVLGTVATRECFADCCADSFMFHFAYDVSFFVTYLPRCHLDTGGYKGVRQGFMLKDYILN